MSATTGHVAAELLGRVFRFATGPGLFSADRVDDGTRLLIENLPVDPPGSVLDMGCGYGALGLPIAARFPEARFTLVDRDTLAVEYARANAETHALGNVETRPSLGYRDLPGDARFSWVLCNVPARIGDEGIRYLIGEGARRLESSGELRVVVITDLAPIVERLEKEEGWQRRARVEGQRHVVFAYGAQPAAGETEHERRYRRDTIEVGALKLDRPHDINEDLGHLREGLPLLLDLLPRSPKGEALVWRGGYGAAAMTLAQRGAKVLAADRDLLATTFTRLNAASRGLSVETVEAHALSRLVEGKGPFSLVAGELHPSAGEALNLEDLLASTRALGPGGQSLWLGLTRQAKGWIDRSRAIKATVIASRGAYSVWRIEASKR